MSFKSFQVRSFSWSIFSCIRTEYGDLLSKSPYSVQIKQNMDQKKLRIWKLFTKWRLDNFKSFLKTSVILAFFETIEVNL